ncbi:MAG: hypothetical protein AAF716_19695 [Cyanobacteria bacterium P01_D01_bin.1]
MDIAMTEDRINSLENRMDRVEAALVSASDFVTQGSAIIQNVLLVTERTAALTERNAEAITRLTQRVDSLAAASERHDRILDYLLSQSADSGNGNN